MRFNKWIQYYRFRDQFKHIDWEQEDSFPQSEIAILLKPLQQCQIGENSEGKNLIRLAEKHVANKEDKSYATAIRLFIKEEQNHSQALKLFLEKHQLPLLASHPVDNTFTTIRRLYNLETCIYTLLTAEIVATFFYQAVKSATSSPLLQSVCKQILRDEAMHLMFQCDILSEVREEGSKLRWHLGQLFFKTLFAGTMQFVWWQYGKVFRAGGFDKKRYKQKLRQLFDECQKRIAGKSEVKINKKRIVTHTEVAIPIAS